MEENALNGVVTTPPPKVKDDIRSYNQIIAELIKECIVANINLTKVRGITNDKPKTVSECEKLCGFAKTYFSNVENFYNLLFPWLDDDSDIHLENIEKKVVEGWDKALKEDPKLGKPNILSSGSFRTPPLKIPQDVVNKDIIRTSLYEAWYRGLLKFAQNKGFLTSEKVQKAQGKELLKEAFL